jgi:hypothetical protein
VRWDGRSDDIVLELYNWGPRDVGAKELVTGPGTRITEVGSRPHLFQEICIYVGMPRRSPMYRKMKHTAPTRDNYLRDEVPWD